MNKYIFPLATIVILGTSSFISCLTSSTPDSLPEILPPNEYQYDVCNKAVECSLVTEELVDKCVKCVDEFLARTSGLSPKEIRDVVFDKDCLIVEQYAKVTGIWDCVN
jgi:hypothetical protein